MFTIKLLYWDNALRTIDGMHNKLQGLERELPKQFLEWQGDDMNRNKPGGLDPFLSDHTVSGIAPRTVAVETRIWKHGRTKARAAKLTVTKRRVGQYTAKGQYKAKPATPKKRQGGRFLRPELLPMLRDRCRKMLESCTWR